MSKRRISALLIVVMIVSLLADMGISGSGHGFGASDVFASTKRESLWATASNIEYKEGSQQDVDIYVIAEDNDVCPGNLSAMTLYLRNNTGQFIEEGELSFRSRYIEEDDGAFLDYEAGEEEDPTVLTGIQLEPGELREIFFEFYTEEEMEPSKASVTFFFKGEIFDEEIEGKRIQSSQRFHYSIGLPNVNLDLRDGNAVYTGIFQEMDIWMSEPGWQDWNEENSEDEPIVDATESEWEDKKATRSETVEDQKATASELDKKEEKDRETIREYQEKAMELSESRVRYELELFGVDIKSFRPRKAKDAEDLGWISCIYRLAGNVRPGVYYGKVKAMGNWNRRSFTTEQGFLFEVTEEGQITLEDSFGGLEIELTGPASSFPEADELELETEPMPEYGREMLTEKGVNEGIYEGFSLQILADGMESQLTGPVKVRLSSDRIQEKTKAYAKEAPAAEMEGAEKELAKPPEEPATPAEIPDEIKRQGPGAVWAYVNGEDVSDFRRIDGDGSLILQQEEEVNPPETVVARGNEADLALLAVELEDDWVEALECGVTDRGWLQVEMDTLSNAYIITDLSGEASLADGWTGTYEDEEIFISVTVPGVHTSSETVRLHVDKIASDSETGGKNQYGTMWDGAQRTLSHGVFSAAFYEIQIEDANTGEPIRLVDGEQDFGHVKVKAYLKDGLPHMDLEGDLKILHYESGVSPPDLVAASTDRNPTDDWVRTEDEEQPVLTASFETDSLGQFGFVWANPVEGVETGGPGTIWVKTAGVLAMLGAVWLWMKDSKIV